MVTGAGGQLGRTLKDKIHQFPGLDGIFLGREDLDITDRRDVFEKLAQNAPDYCINCAAYTLVDQAEKDPQRALEVNAEAVGYLVEACRVMQVVLVHISTDYVFDGTRKAGYVPGDTPNPINAYGRSKLLGELRILEGLKRFFIIRTSWLYSRQYGPNFYLRILEKARSGEELHVVDNQRGCPTLADNLAIYLLKLVSGEPRPFGIYHFTDGKAMTWFEFAREILIEHSLQHSAQLVKDNKSRSFARRPVNSILLRNEGEFL
nr:dTDP-4-dehydrorhamnose reductase [Robiginitalea sp. SC105]